MSNTLGTLASGVILQRALDLVFTKRPILNRISLDLSDDKAKFNQTVYSRIYSIPAVGDFGDSATAKSDTDVPVSISQFKQIYHSFTPQELSSTDRNLVDEAAEPLATAIANYFVDQIAALWTEGNFTNETAEAVSSCDYETLVALRKSLITRGAPDNRFAAVNADVYEKFLADSRIVQAYSNAKSDAINTGVISAVAGMDVFEYPACPTTNDLIGFAGSKDSCVIATRIPRDPREVLPNAQFPGVLEPVTNAATGLTVLANEWIDPATLSANVRVIFMAGFAKGNANNGQRLVKAETSSSSSSST